MNAAALSSSLIPGMTSGLGWGVVVCALVIWVVVTGDGVFMTPYENCLIGGTDSVVGHDTGVVMSPLVLVCTWSP